MEALVQDVRYGVRALLRSLLFTLTAGLTLALCMAVSMALFTVVHNVLLRPLQVPESDRVVLIYNSYPNAGVPHAGASVLDYLDRMRDLTVFEEQALFNVFNPTVDVNGSPERSHAMRLTPSFFRLIKVQPRTGRAFSEAEGEEGHDPVAVIGRGLAQRLFGADDVVGRQVRIDGRTHTVVGVMAADFAFIDSAVQLWLPAVFTDQQKQVGQRLSNNWDYIGRLKRDATVSRAQAQVDALNASNLDRFPMFKTVLTNAGFRSVAVRLPDDLVSDVGKALNLLWIESVFVTFIG
jgi:hypothetical protein